MTNSIITSNGFTFAGVRAEKQEKTQAIKQVRKDKEYEIYKAGELNKAFIRNSEIPTGAYCNQFSFSACIKELRRDIKRTRTSVRETVVELQREDDTQVYNVERNYDLQITFLDDDGRNESYETYEEIILNELTKQDLIDIKEKLVAHAHRNPTDFKGTFGFGFDGRIDISSRDKKEGYTDYEIGEYIDASLIWDSSKGWRHS